MSDEQKPARLPGPATVAIHGAVEAKRSGQPIVPPIVTVTNWQVLIPFYVVLIAVVTGALLLLRRPGAERRNQSAEV